MCVWGGGGGGGGIISKSWRIARPETAINVLSVPDLTLTHKYNTHVVFFLFVCLFILFIYFFCEGEEVNMAVMMSVRKIFF